MELPLDPAEIRSTIEVVVEREPDQEGQGLSLGWSLETQSKAGRGGSFPVRLVDDPP